VPADPPRAIAGALAGLLCVLAVVTIVTAQARPRARDIGLAPGPLATGSLNAITDVAGVTVGQVSVVRGDSVRTGVTAILPHGGNLFRDKVPGGVFVGNAFGKLAGSTQVQELGTIETPIVLTNTLAVGTAVEATVRWTLAQPGNADVRSVNALVGETNDGGLNDIRALPVTGHDVQRAIAGAAGGPVDEGAVGAGTGTIAFGWKGGIGTSSRVVGEGEAQWTVGALVQSNYGGRLTMGGLPIWRLLPVSRATASGAVAPSADGSCMIVVATDAPLASTDLERLAARALFALARTGSSYSNGSGDYAIAFSTHPGVRIRSEGRAVPQSRAVLMTDALSDLFVAAMDATEESVYNSLLRASDTTANGRTVKALPVDEVRRIVAQSTTLGAH
jgi:D-aminopeptidase